MSFKVVLVENDVKITVKLNNLVLTKENDEIWIPVNDISTVVLDNLKISVSVRMLCTLAENTIAVIFCDQKHLPIGFYSSYDNHSRVSKHIGYQIEKTQEYYDILWKTIVEQKLRNQAKVLRILGKETEAAEHIMEFAEDVLPGDSANREAHGAKVYFNALMGVSFSRGNEDILLNSGLDYGYTILRSYLARLCVGYGLNSQLGIHHKNEYNRFNLIDDLIEPIRPIVDIFAYRLLEGKDFFQIEDRRQLINIVNHKIMYKNRKMYFGNMLEDYVSSFAGLLAGRNTEIVYPDVEYYLGEEDEI